MAIDRLQKIRMQKAVVTELYTLLDFIEDEVAREVIKERLTNTKRNVKELQLKQFSGHFVERVEARYNMQLESYHIKEIKSLLSNKTKLKEAKGDREIHLVRYSDSDMRLVYDPNDDVLVTALPYHNYNIHTTIDESLPLGVVK